MPSLTKFMDPNCMNLWIMGTSTSKTIETGECGHIHRGANVHHESHFSFLPGAKNAPGKTCFATFRTSTFISTPRILEWKTSGDVKFTGKQFMPYNVSENVCLLKLCSFVWSFNDLKERPRTKSRRVVGTWAWTEVIASCPELRTSRRQAPDPGG